MVSAVSAGSAGCARAATAANAMTHGTQRRMARQTWWVLRRRATPCGRRAGNQLSLAMIALRPVVLLTVLLAAACARSDLGAPCHVENAAGAELIPQPGRQDRKSTRLNSSHSQISYAVFCLKKKKKKII